MVQNSPTRKIFVLAFTALLFACFSDAPRNNPLDPENPDTNMEDINGSVLTYRVPHQLISDIKIIWRDERLVYTNESGKFSFTNIEHEDGWLVFISPDYIIDSLYIDWRKYKPNFEHYLNARPILRNILFYSSIENDYPERQDISLIFNVDVFDPDNDIDSVLVQSPSLGISTFLEYDFNQRTYRRILEMSDLNINSAEAVIGKEFQISVKDKFKNIIPLSGQIVKRIIKEEVLSDRSEESDTLSVKPTLKWEPINPGFPFVYMVEIYTNKPNKELVYRRENIAPTVTSITLDQALPEDNYFWIVWVIDEFNNRSASKPKSFYAR